MPSSSDRPRLCIFGDSHLASIRRALDVGILDLSAYEVEFWGAPGRMFRSLKQTDGVISGSGRALRTAVSISRRGRRQIAPTDFDVFLFYGARFHASSFFSKFLHLQYDMNMRPSLAVLEAAASNFLMDSRGFQLAAGMTKAGAGQVFYAPTPFPTAQVMDLTRPGELLDRYAGAANATSSDRHRLWAALSHAAAQSGVQLLQQPDHTVVQGILTDERYASEDARIKKETGHKSPEFAVQMLSGFPAANTESGTSPLKASTA